MLFRSIVLVRGIYLKGVGVQVLVGEALLMVAFGVGLFVLAVTKFKRKLS